MLQSALQKEKIETGIKTRERWSVDKTEGLKWSYTQRYNIVCVKNS